MNELAEVADKQYTTKGLKGLNKGQLDIQQVKG